MMYIEAISDVAKDLKRLVFGPAGPSNGIIISALLTGFI